MCNIFRRVVVGAPTAGVRLLVTDAVSVTPLPGYSAEATVTDFSEVVEAVA